MSKLELNNLLGGESELKLKDLLGGSSHVSIHDISSGLWMRVHPGGLMTFSSNFDLDKITRAFWHVMIINGWIAGSVSIMPGHIKNIPKVEIELTPDLKCIFKSFTPNPRVKYVWEYIAKHRPCLDQP